MRLYEKKQGGMNRAYTPARALQYLQGQGVKISRATLFRALASGRIKSRKLNGETVIDEATLNSLIAQKEHSALYPPRMVKSNPYAETVRLWRLLFVYDGVKVAQRFKASKRAKISGLDKYLPPLPPPPPTFAQVLQTFSVNQIRLLQLSLVSLTEEVRQIPPSYAESFKRILAMYEKTSGDKYANAMAKLPGSLHDMSTDTYNNFIRGLAEHGISGPDVECFKKIVSLLWRRSWRTRLRTASGAKSLAIKKRLKRAKNSKRVANFESSLQMIRSYAVALRRYMTTYQRMDIQTADHIFKTVILDESKMLESSKQNAVQYLAVPFNDEIRSGIEAPFFGIEDTCPYCGEPVDEDRASCPHCGQFYQIVFTYKREKP